MENYSAYTVAKELSGLEQGSFHSEIQFKEDFILVTEGFMELDGSKPRLIIYDCTGCFEDEDIDLPEESLNEIENEFNEIFN